MDRLPKIARKKLREFLVLRLAIAGDSDVRVEIQSHQPLFVCYTDRPISDIAQLVQLNRGPFQKMRFNCIVDVYQITRDGPMRWTFNNQRPIPVGRGDRRKATNDMKRVKREFGYHY